MSAEVSAPGDNLAAVSGTGDVDDNQPQPTGCLVAFKLNNSDQPPERAMLSSRDGNRVYVRAVDPCDPQPPNIRASPGDEGTVLKNDLAELYVRRVAAADDPLDDGVPLFTGDEVAVMEHISHISHHTAMEGDEGYLLWQRIVPTREEPGRVFARTLRHDEPDDGRRAHVRPGDQLILDDIRLEIDYVDQWEGEGVTGYVPLTPVLFTWMRFGTGHSEDKQRYLLSAARRLDRAQTLFERVGELRDQLQNRPPEGAPALRRAAFELIGTTEMAIVALNRAMTMCADAMDAIGTSVSLPMTITNLRECVVQIRDSYEHIDERAVGEVRRNPNINAHSIFDHDQIVANGVITYGGYYLDLATDVPDLITAVRQYLKDAAAETLPSNSSTSTVSGSA
ncbi:hypothetical protein MINTM003_21250 [Mycobacterium paraintracellulare]|uniref:Light-mediated development protein DET1 n=1 Tax=Mycobacterium indicus pranii (strain DSM 45239 / MTCC 9506) TaxID=1232724 RepID=J9WAA0_MYCIP|nr:Light-mediated development protein DET1 [Mycobacterium intracellulare subsp. intracellulare MTCC 9506]BCO51684.1 hypothetical protein MINTM003_21250 [Mycobacterium paraintracellulare]BCO88872.1 hypothetical protein MINTM015_21290 [Mycobacterium paraintracellulare]